MKKTIRIALWLIAAGTMMAIVVVGLEARRVLKGYHDTIIISGGSFDSQFASLYTDTPEKKHKMEQWLLNVIPQGTPREEARRILSRSFSSDLTSGKKTVIDESGSGAGGESTSVTIHFDNQGRVRSVEVNQHRAYL
jgi:hypothetical protein